MNYRSLTAAALLLAMAASLLAAADEKPFRIEKGAFVDTATGKPLRPCGFNYIRLFSGHGTFDPAHYDSAAAEAALRRFQADGFRVVRVFINTHEQAAGAVAQKGQTGLSREYLRNVADFLVRSSKHSVAVMLSLETFPRVSPYTESLRPLPESLHGANARYLDAGHLAAKARFLGDFIAGLKAENPQCLGAVFSYDLENELSFTGAAPFTLTTGDFTAPNGKAYALPGDRQQLADDSAVYFIDRMAEAIHAAHPGALVSASVFTYRAVGKTGPGDFTVEKAGWKNRYPFRPLAVLRSQADFLDLHFYSADTPGIERDLESVEFDALREAARRLGKPIIAGEFGAFKGKFAAVEPAATWMGDLAAQFARRGFAGWLYWTYDSHEQSKELWNACDQDGLIYGRLAEVVRAENYNN